MNRKTFFQLTFFFLIWRLVLFGIGVIASQVLSYQPSFPYAYTLLPLYNLPQWFYSWANFDGVHYISLAEHGYIGTGLVQAFFPVFPGLIDVTRHLFANTIVAGLILSNVIAGGLVLLWYSFIRSVFPHQNPMAAVLILFLFPTAFFFGALYSEALFLCLVLGAFLAARAKNWWLAGILTSVAGATRVVGVALIPSLMVELYLQEREFLLQHQPTVTWLGTLKSIFHRQLTAMVWIGSGGLGLVAYMWFLKAEFHDPLYFLHVQAEFGAGRQEQLVLYPQVVWRYVKILWTYRPIDWKYFAYIQEAVFGILGFVGVIVAIKRVRPSYVMFSAIAFLLPTLTGNFSSISRYLLACFAIFLLIHRWLKNRGWFLVIYLLGSSLLLLINIMLFIQGYWVA